MSSGLDVWRQRVLDSSDNAYRADTAVCVAMQDTLYFSSFGRHMINDALHALELWPGIPIGEICASPARFEQFKDGLLAYTSELYERHRKYCCAKSNNGDNPFAYQHNIASKYDAMMMKVFRKCYVQISAQRYNSMVQRGDFDPRHIIGLFGLL